jgi:hypothetical protein
MEAETPWRTVEEAAAYLRSAKATLDKLRINGGGPLYTKMGRRVIYHINDLDSFAAGKQRESTSNTMDTIPEAA